MEKCANKTQRNLDQHMMNAWLPVVWSRKSLELCRWSSNVDAWTLQHPYIRQPQSLGLSAEEPEIQTMVGKVT